jgi:TPR repeat protein
MRKRTFPLAGFLLCLALASAQADAMSVSSAKALERAAQDNNDTKALTQLENAAHGGDAVAQVWLGNYFSDHKVASNFALPPDEDRRRKDHELEANSAEAVEWYRKSADQGNADAQCLLGVMYANGSGVPEDKDQAFKWYSKSANQGNTDCQTNVGIMYYYGHGVPKDYAKAVEWFRKSADQSNAYGQFFLGLAYATGPGVTEDNLIFDALGHGVPYDNVIAYALFNLVALKDISDNIGALGYRDRLATKMSGTQIQAAQALTLMMQKIGVTKTISQYGS